MQPDQQPGQPGQSEEWQTPPEVTGQAPHPYVDPSLSQPVPEEAVDTDEAARAELAPQPRPGEEELVRWQAPATIERAKDVNWYMIFGATTLVLFVLAIFIFRSWSFAALIPIMAVSLVFYIRRSPEIISYTLSRKGIHINDELRPYEEFREFTVTKEEGENSVFLVPRERFKLGVTAYFPEEVGEAVVDMLAARLPMNQNRRDPIESLLRRLRI